MPPIRLGDGTTVAPKGFSEVRKGDGTILSSGNAIPDTLVDNFEDDPDGVYDDTTSLADIYSVTNVFERQTTTVLGDGNYSLRGERDSSSNSELISTSGLPNYPSQGDRIWFLQQEETDAFGRTFFGYQDDSNNYSVDFSEGGTFALNKDGTTQASTTTTVTADTTYLLEIDWESDGTITVRQKEWPNAEPGPGTAGIISEISWTDSSPYTSGGIGFFAARINSQTQVSSYWDQFVFDSL